MIGWVRERERESQCAVIFDGTHFHNPHGSKRNECVQNQMETTATTTRTKIYQQQKCVLRLHTEIGTTVGDDGSVATYAVNRKLSAGGIKNMVLGKTVWIKRKNLVDKIMWKIKINIERTRTHTKTRQLNPFNINHANWKMEKYHRCTQIKLSPHRHHQHSVVGNFKSRFRLFVHSKQLNEKFQITAPPSTLLGMCQRLTENNINFYQRFCRLNRLAEMNISRNRFTAEERGGGGAGGEKKWFEQLTTNTFRQRQRIHRKFTHFRNYKTYWLITLHWCICKTSGLSYGQ